ncbi:acriflavine resistance protein B [Alsobacter soli]|uniref:Acriflavine resistance protein B n=1 Tax=Alsobacter soli TaxID=2109933 RepID=A0A2T1HRD2_9HYPH|nr:efflux RND transporter permease subunit [Alsobacter soli]PSC04218.1 acriflavine resistance protein B [Alsobacter soli]
MSGFSISEPFIRRPVGTTLLAIGLLLMGLAAYQFLPVASLPTVDLPTIRISSSRPGADPQTMAATVAAPLERRLGEIAGVTEITSRSSLGMANITVQFDASRNVDGAARDVQAALNAAATDLPGDLPTLPTFRKMNPAAAPVLILALTSDTVAPSAIYDAADSVIAQRIAQVSGVGDVSVAGAEQPAIRVKIDPSRLAAMGVSMEAVRTVITAANALAPIGSIDGDQRLFAIATNAQLRTAEDVGKLLVRSSNGVSVKLADVATVEPGTRNRRSAASYNGKPAVLITITKQADANVIAIVDQIKALLPELGRWIPAGITVNTLSDRTVTIRASVDDMQWTLAATVGLVMLVVFLFLRRLTPTLAAGVTVPLALAGATAAMWAAGFSLDNISLMALAVSVGFVVDDAIVMIENVDRNRAAGMGAMQAAIEGARQIGFTVVAISLSLLAAFSPMFLMGGVMGKFFGEFALTLAFTIVVSTLVSLTVTPMICARTPAGDGRQRLLDRVVEGALAGLVRFYDASLSVVLRQKTLAVLILLATVAASVHLFVKTPKGFFPQDDTGLLFGFTEASTDISFPAMLALQERVAAIVEEDPAIAGVGSTVGSSGWSGSVNQGQMYVSMKPLDARGGVATNLVIDRLRRKLAAVPGIRVFLFQSQDVRVGGRQGNSPNQFTLWDPDYAELVQWAPKVLEAIQAIPGLVDVSSDRQPNGLQASVVIDRAAASRLGVRIQDIDDALNNGFAQRQISTIYTARNQYRIVMDVDERFQRDPSDLANIYVSGAGGVQLPLSSVAKVERTLAPLVVNHQGQFPSATITYDMAPGVLAAEAQRRILQAVAAMHLPDGLHAEFAGDAKAFAQSAGSQPMLVLIALVTVYLVLGILYEDLAHPLTILSTLPSAALGALLALKSTGMELSIIAFIGVILLIGIVKKNGIMLVDFALDAERRRGMAPLEAIHEACLERFRPILMTTLAALLGAVPLIVATGPGSELRRPLGVTIAGGLIVSQLLTLYTTPVIYLLMDKIHRRRRTPARVRLAEEPTPRPEGAAV